MNDQANFAIQAALSRNWKEAIRLNLLILKKDSKDIDALNRLGRAYFETAQKTKSELTYKKVLRIDKFNHIAAKSLELLKTSRVSRVSKENMLDAPAPTAEFLEEPGITKTVSLTRLGDPKIIAGIHPGDPVLMVARDHCVAIISITNQYLGRLPDDLASRLMPLMRSGNKFHTWVRSLDGLKVFIKEVSRSQQNHDSPSFPPTEKLTYAAFTPPELIHTEKPDVSGTEEQEEYVSADADMEQEETEPHPIPTAEE